MGDAYNNIFIGGEINIYGDTYYNSKEGFIVRTGTRRKTNKELEDSLIYGTFTATTGGQIPHINLGQTKQYKQCDCCGSNGELHNECEYCGQIIIKN